MDTPVQKLIIISGSSVREIHIQEVLPFLYAVDSRSTCLSVTGLFCLANVLKVRLCCHMLQNFLLEG